jgi:hypothetical protein
MLGQAKSTFFEPEFSTLTGVRSMYTNLQSDFQEAGSGLRRLQMKRFFQNLAGVSLGLVGLLIAPLAKAETTYDFSVNLTQGSVTGTLLGTVDLPFVNPGGTGSGAASSLVLTSIPAGFGALVGGDTATAWADQNANTFTVVNGTITSVEFIADTGAAPANDDLCLNSTANSPTFNGWDCPSGLNELDVHQDVTFGFNENGLAGITFSTPASATPEPGTFGALMIGLGFLVVMLARKSVANHSRPKCVSWN